MPESLDGLVTFFASHHAIRAEKVLGEAGHDVQLIPGPKELSPNCGTAVRFVWDEREAALSILDTERVEIDQVMEYTPKTDSFSRRRSLLGRKKS